MVLKIYKLRFVIIAVFLIFAAGYSKANNFNKSSLYQQNHGNTEFDELVSKFNRALSIKNTSLAISYLNRAEHLLTDLKGIDPIPMYAFLANGFARTEPNVKKATSSINFIFIIVLLFPNIKRKSQTP